MNYQIQIYYEYLFFCILENLKILLVFEAFLYREWNLLQVKCSLRRETVAVIKVASFLVAYNVQSFAFGGEKLDCPPGTEACLRCL